MAEPILNAPRVMARIGQRPLQLGGIISLEAGL
jgi:hypothetical protein